MRSPFLDSTLKLTDLVTETRLLHMLIAGATGTGKSTLLKEIALRDAEAGRGLLLLDPHGDLAEDVLQSMPRRRRNDVVRLNAAEPESCPGLNPLRVDPASRALVVANIIATMRRLFDPGLWGPRTEHLLRHALLALTEVRGATLADARDMLVDEKRRRSILKQVRDENVRSFWMKEFVGYGARLQAEFTAPLLNKLGAILGNSAVRTIVLRSRPRIDARRLIDRGAIVIASLPRGRIGEDATTMLGGLLLGAFQQAALSRANVDVTGRRPFFIIVDEVASFVSAPLLSLVAEARKYAVGLVLAGQSLAVMDDATRAALVGNAGTLISFRVGAEDARIFSAEFANEVEARHLQRLTVHECAVRSGVGPTVVLKRAPVLQSS